MNLAKRVKGGVNGQGTGRVRVRVRRSGSDESLEERVP